MGIFPTSGMQQVWTMVALNTVRGCWQSRDISLVQASASIGAREYSRSNPPSLARHGIGPDSATGSERTIGVRSSSTHDAGELVVMLEPLE